MTGKSFPVGRKAMALTGVRTVRCGCGNHDMQLHEQNLMWLSTLAARHGVRPVFSPHKLAEMGVDWARPQPMQVLTRAVHEACLDDEDGDDDGDDD